MQGSTRRRAAAALGAAGLFALSITGVANTANASPGQTVTDLTGALTPEELAGALVGAGVTISNVTYVGADAAGGTFSGMGAAGFDSGVVLSSGSATEVVGPNDSDGTSTDHDRGGDADLTAIAGVATHDAAVLEFDFVPAGTSVVFEYVFGSEEYNEYIGAFNDAFAFIVNGTNCATVGDPPVPVSVNNINGASNPSLFRNNDPSDGTPPIDVELDGLTTVLQCSAAVNAGVANHMKLAIADASDYALDSAVFLRAGSVRVNNAPVAVDDAYSVVTGTTLSVSAPGVLGNDSDPDEDPLTAVLGTTTTNGTLALDPAGSLTYTPNAGYVGTDSFTYTASDGAAPSNVATVTLTVQAAPPPPPPPPPPPASTTTTTTEVDEPTTTTTEVDETTTTSEVDETTTTVVNGTTPADPPADTESGALARTGAAISSQTGLALLVFVAGGLLVAASRRLRMQS